MENNEVPPLSLRLVKKTVIKSFPYITIHITIFKASLEKVFHRYLQKSKNQNGFQKP